MYDQSFCKNKAFIQFLFLKSVMHYAILATPRERKVIRLIHAK